MEGILSNVHKFHTVYSSWHYVESCKIMMDLFFSIRTDDVPNFGPIVYIYIFFSPLERSMQPGLVERAQAL